MTRRTLTLTCDHCGDLVRRHLADTDLAANVLPAWRIELHAEGWSFDGELDACPTCTQAAEPVDFIPAEEITR